MASGQKRAARAVVRPRLPDRLSPAALPRDDIRDDSVLSALRFDGVDLSARRARLVDFEGCHLAGTTLAGGSLDRLSLVDSVLDQCDLANLLLDHSSLTRVELTGCRATGLVASGCLLRNITLRDCSATLSAFRYATFTKVHLLDCRLEGTDMIGCDLTGATFWRCDLSRAELSQVRARGAVFVDCGWDGVRGITSLAGATVVHSSPLDAHAFMLATSASLAITVGDADDFPEPG